MLRISRIGLFMGATAMMVAMSATAFAQGPRGGRGFGGLQLLSAKQVQEELKMTPAQVEKLGVKQKEVQTASGEIMQAAGGFQNLSDADRKKLQELQAKAVTDVLEPKQMKRFNELNLQLQGVGAVVNRKELAEQLKITDEQLQKIRDIQMAARQEMQSSLQGFDFQNATDEERQKMRAKQEESRKATNEKLVAVLTDAQKKQWTEMTGVPFKFPPMGGFGGRRARN